jgi:hypothetical protein
MDRVMPILKPAGYRQNEKLFFRELLLDSTAAPVVAFGIDQGNRVAYQGAADEADLEQRLPSLRDEALKNLSIVEVRIDIRDAEGSRIAFVVGAEYASEKILDQEFMKTIAEKLGVSGLLVGIPFRGTLVAVEANSSIRMKFPAIIKKYFDNPQGEPVSDKVFLVKEGQVIAMGGEKIEDEASGSFSISEEASGLLTVQLATADRKEMFPEINQAIESSLTLLVARKQADAKVNFYLNPVIRFDGRLIEELDNYCRQILQHSKNRVGISFYSGDVKLAPADPAQAAGNYGDLSENELREEFYRLVAVPDAHKNPVTLTAMSALLREFKNRGLRTPDPNYRPVDPDKKWWQFWK